MMKVILAGGSGQVGTLLAGHFGAQGHEVVNLSRKLPLQSAARTVHWDGENLGNWTAEVDGSDILVNLAGWSVNCRYHAENRRRIMDSRINSTRVLAHA